jgi:hypothetical protein
LHETLLGNGLRVECSTGFRAAQRETGGGFNQSAGPANVVRVVEATRQRVLRPGNTGGAPGPVGLLPVSL